MSIAQFHKNLAKGDNIPLFIKAPFLTLSSWLFQGLLYMDFTEKLFKIFIDVIFFIPLYFLFINLVSFQSSLFFAVILSHTLNWIFNGQIFVLFKNLGLTNTEQKYFTKYIKEFKKRVSKEKSILVATTLGSISRGELKKTSDLDIRIIRKLGPTNGVRSCFFVFFERFGAFFQRFPLDIYVLDNIDRLPKQLKNNEKPIVIYDPHMILKKHGINVFQEGENI